MGSDSGYLKQVNGFDTWRKIKTRLFLSPYIFDDFLPHFSLLQNYVQKNHQSLKKELKAMTEDCNDICLNKIAFVIRESDEENFRVFGYL